jgi:hypothetical protein
MPNIQQPEMRRSEQDPLVTSSVKDTAQNAIPQPRDDRALHRVPEDERSPYGPQPTK